MRPFMSLLLMALLATFPLSPAYADCPQASGCPLAPGLFITRAQLTLAKQRIAADTSPYAGFASSFISSANGLLASTPDPFKMDDISTIEFGWCGSAGGEDNTFKDLVEKLTSQSNSARNLAVAYLLTGNTDYAAKARDYLLAWAGDSSLLNMYAFNINFSSASFDGIESGYCNNSWNMALDSMWQTYGLINFSDAYAILTRNDFQLTSAQKTTIRNWLENQLIPAVNAGFHTWTRWADAHTSSSAYTRYRSDNHLSWSLAGLAAAAAALEKADLWAYVYTGGSYNDGRSGDYANPSHLTSFIDYALAADGQIFDQNERASEHKGLFYGNFSLWAMAYSAQIAEVHSGDNYWTLANADGASLATGFDFYARYTSGQLSPPDPDEATDPAFFRFMYELVVGNDWVTGSRATLYTNARNSGARTQMVEQGIGPVSLLTGDFAAGSGGANRPSPPTNVTVEEHSSGSSETP